MLDTKGPEIRTGMNKDGKPIELFKGQTLKIVTDYAIEGDNTRIACSYKSLPESVQQGSTIFIADGSLTVEVAEVVEVSYKTKNNYKKSIRFSGIQILNALISNRTVSTLSSRTTASLASART
jgi:pyruvate kinase